MTRVIKGTGVSVAASQSSAHVSKAFQPRDPLNIIARVELSAVAETTGITLKLMESYNGSEFHAVGDQSEVTLSSIEIDSSSDVNTSTDVITETGHGLETGDILIAQEDNTLPTGISDGDVLYVIYVSANTFKVASSYDDAVNGTQIDLTAAGSSTNTFFKGCYEIRMVESDSSDAAQLPLADYVVVAVDTGSGDTLTVSEVYTPTK